MSFKGVFSILSSEGHFVQQSRTIFTILVKGHPRKISVKSFWKTGHGPRRRYCPKFFLFLALTAICSSKQNHFNNFGRGSPKEHFCKIVLKSTHWPRKRCYLNVFFLFLVLMAVLFSGVDPQWQFGRGSSKKHFCEILLKSAYWPWSRCCSTFLFFIFCSGGAKTF